MCGGAGNPTGEESPVAALLVAVERFRTRPGPDQDGHRLAEELVPLRRACDLLELEFARDAHAFAQTEEAENRLANAPVEWLRHECKTSIHAANTALQVGRAESLLPAGTAAMEQGQIGFGHLALMASTVLAVRDPEGERGFDEGALLTLALEHSVSRFRHDCAHVRHAADADGYLEEQVEAVTWRRLELLPCGDGRLALRGLLDPVGGATVRTALEPLARPDGKGDRRHRQRRLADALIELSHHGLDAGAVPGHAGQRTHLHVTTTLETLRELAGAPAGELEWSTPIPAATVQRLACDADVIRILLGPQSEVLDVGRARRVPSPAQRRALALRDQGCVWPGCERPPAWTQPHHRRPWAQGGRTDLESMELLCWRHHEKVHEGRWRLFRHPDGRYDAVPTTLIDFDRARAPDFFAA